MAFAGQIYGFFSNATSLKKKKKKLLGFCTIHTQLCVKNDAKVLLWT